MQPRKVTTRTPIAPGLRLTKHVSVRQLVASPTRARLFFGPVSWLVEIGHAGVMVRKREGDQATPAGILHPGLGFFRSDRLRRPGASGLAWRATHRNDAWCDVAGDRNYNRYVRLPYRVLDEHLWRDDPLYDVCLTTDHNQRPRRHKGGSAIFIHVARGAGRRLAASPQPTAGCIAMPAERLRWFCAHLTPAARIDVMTRQNTSTRRKTATASTRLPRRAQHRPTIIGMTAYALSKTGR